MKFTKQRRGRFCMKTTALKAQIIQKKISQECRVSAQIPLVLIITLFLKDLTDKEILWFIINMISHKRWRKDAFIWCGWLITSKSKRNSTRLVARHLIQKVQVSINFMLMNKSVPTVSKMTQTILKMLLKRTCQAKIKQQMLVRVQW